jgi:signal transduction histidine kinase
MPPQQPALHFDVHPSVVFQLGNDLITDEVQALIEIVKNCYDAGATYAKVEIQTRSRCGDSFPNTLFPDAPGFIAVTDDGEGMDVKALQSGWLIISNSPKRRLKLSGELGKGQRTPLGDKGLGRLASQRLGENVEVVTTAKGSLNEEHVGFSWSSFQGHEALTQVPVKGPFTRPSTRKRGTTILISGLVDPDHWERPDRSPKGRDFKQYYEEQLAELISPFDEIANFTVHVSINGTQLDLARVPRQVRQEADITFSFVFDGEKLQATGKTKLRTLRPAESSRRDVFSRHCEGDSGDELLQCLLANPKSNDLRVKGSRSSAWFVEVSLTDSLSDQKGVLPGSSRPISPGPFRGELDGFSLGPDRAEEQQAFSTAREYKEYVKNLAGVYVFRDGFGIRVDEDFLQLGKAWTGGGSWYGFKPANTIGFVAISARDNPQLEETTSREGFIDKPSYRNFRLLLRRFVKFAADAMEFLRRETIAFCDARMSQEAQVPENISPDSLAEGLGQELLAASELGKRTEAIRAELADSGKTVSSVSRTMKSSLFASMPEYREAQASLQSAEVAVDRGQKALTDAGEILTHLSQIQKRFAVLEAHISRFNERLSQAYEMIGVGLTAEVLAHEIRQIADGLDQRTGAILEYLKGIAGGDAKVAAYARHVRSSVAALRKQLGHLDPSLKYVRHHESLWKGQPLGVEIRRLDRKPFVVQVNRGKLTQIFDNLLLNSEYWLKEDLRLRRMETGEVLIELRPPQVWFSDNGRGIDPSVENSLFEPFVTTKPDGRGLGLFVVKEFLESEGCRIGLYSERNQQGRLYAFELDLSGMIHG